MFALFLAMNLSPTNAPTRRRRAAWPGVPVFPRIKPICTHPAPDTMSGAVGRASGLLTLDLVVALLTPVGTCPRNQGRDHLLGLLQTGDAEPQPVPRQLLDPPLDVAQRPRQPAHQEGHRVAGALLPGAREVAGHDRLRVLPRADAGGDG